MTIEKKILSNGNISYTFDLKDCPDLDSKIKKLTMNFEQMYREMKGKLDGLPEVKDNTEIKETNDYDEEEHFRDS